MGVQDWKSAAEYEINKMFDSEPNEKNAIFFNALLGVIDYIDNSSQEHNNPITDRVQNSLIDERKQESLDYFIDYMGEKSLYQTTGISSHNEYAYESLKKMLAIDEDVANMLFMAADNEEKKLIKQSYKNILDRLR